MLTINKKTVTAPANEKKWLDELWAVTGEKPKYFSIPEGFGVTGISRDKWIGKVDRTARRFELTQKDAGLFKAKLSRFTIYGEIKEGIVSKKLETRIELNWTSLIGLGRPMFLLLVLKDLSPDVFGLLLGGCLVTLEILLLILEYNQAQQALDESFSSPIKLPTSPLSLR